ncbi:hypothetical protein MPTK1_6g15670 [Marchantia polymorpha subsp. ruderalis]|uniref:Uncharacterized protein n=2 Tax=Marchantia polymorpha TaxID=3197 RepID=A0AAF6BSG0_MARPO|nr:hypothetical protein MARPO_0056s0079 [Marchantia polymorpha]BBN14944.1 hypothetical protein Mp_6g15670 [Marchantia polymorpha subsp. ruderalis]|eukprot:PTQ37628.1 hypothetical protein MARPO_0056s0079 [Marchantia polymorpha]
MADRLRLAWGRRLLSSVLSPLLSSSSCSPRESNLSHFPPCGGGVSVGRVRRERERERESERARGRFSVGDLVSGWGADGTLSREQRAASERAEFGTCARGDRQRGLIPSAPEGSGRAPRRAFHRQIINDW